MSGKKREVTILEYIMFFSIVLPQHNRRHLLEAYHGYLAHPFFNPSVSPFAICLLPLL